MNPVAHHPILIFIVGPPAVGKMTVGHELAQRTGLRLFHNHHTIDLVLPYFAFGTPPFQRLVGEFRRRILEEIAASELPRLDLHIRVGVRRPQRCGCRRGVRTQL